VDEAGRRGSYRAVFATGSAYFVAGLAFAALAGSASSARGRVGWRLVAWAISAVAFAAHVAYERLRLRKWPVTTALHASLAVALGAFALAAAANVRAAVSASADGRSRLYIALVAWPLLTAIPAFFVALAAGAALTPWLRRSPHDRSELS
jgi:hypothetical protein